MAENSRASILSCMPCTYVRDCEEHLKYLALCSLYTEIKEVHAYGASLKSISGVIGLGSFTNLKSLHLHGNHIAAIEGLETLHNLEDLNLSSNRITKIEGLSHLSNLRVLDLSSNCIQVIEGLDGLSSLARLGLAHNYIEKLRGLAVKDGPGYTLQFLDLRGNEIYHLSELWFLARCIHLQELLLSRLRQSNPVCRELMYVPTILSVLPNLQILDGRLLLPPNSMGHSKFSRGMILNASNVPSQRNLYQLDSSAHGLFGYRGDGNSILNSYMQMDYQQSNCWLQQESVLSKALNFLTQNSASISQIKANKVDRACSPELLNEESLLSNFLHQDNNLERAEPSCKVNEPAGCLSQLLKTDDHEVQHQKMPTDIDIQSNTIRHFDHDLIGFHRKKNVNTMYKMDAVLDQQLDRLNLLEQRLKNVESCAWQNSIKVNDFDNDKSNVPSEGRLQYNRAECIPTRILLVQLVIPNAGVIDDKVTNENSIKMFEESTVLYDKLALTAGINVKRCMVEKSTSTDTNITNEQGDNLTTVEAGGYVSQQSHMIDLDIPKELLKDEKVVQLQKDLEEKNAEIIKYKHGLMKLEEMLQEKESPTNALAEKRFLEAFVFAKAEKTVLKEALDAEKIAHQVAEVGLKEVTTERNQLHKCLSTLSKEASSKIQYLSAQLKTYKLKDSLNIEEIKRLSALKDMVHIEFQREIHKIKSFIESLAMQGPAESFNASEGLKLARLDGTKGELITDRQGYAKVQSEDSKEHDIKDSESLKEIIQQLENVKERIEDFKVQARRADEHEKEINVLKTILENERSVAEDNKRQLELLRSNNSFLLEEKSSVSLILQENTQKIESLEDALKVKNKMLDSQNDSIRELKCSITDLKRQINEKTLAIQSVEQTLRTQLQEKADQVHTLRAEVSEQELVIAELEDELERQKEVKAEFESEKVVMEKRIQEKDDMLRYIEGELERIQKLYEKRERSLKLEKDKAVDSVDNLTREKAVLKAELQELQKQIKHVEEKENSWREAYDNQGKQLFELREAFSNQGKQVSELKEQLSSMAAALDTETTAKEKIKALYNSKVNQLNKALQELQSADI